MICQNCRTNNNEGNKFCVKCGNPLTNNNPINNKQMNNNLNNINNQNMVNNNMNNNMVNNNVNMRQPMNQNKNNGNNEIKVSFGDYFKIIIAFLTKPFNALKNENNKFSNFKNSFILSIIVSILFTIISFIKTIISTVRVTTGGLFSEPETEWVWENLENLNFIKVIGTDLLIIIGIIFAIACVYYIAGLVVKKQPNFSKLLGLSTVSVVPMFICAMLLSPIFGLIHVHLGVIVTIIGGIYTLILVYENMNSEINLEGNIKYYFNLICLSILMSTGYFVYMKFITSTIKDAFDMF